MSAIAEQLGLGTLFPFFKYTKYISAENFIFYTGRARKIYHFPCSISVFSKPEMLYSVLHQQHK
uniref:Uncharacterized protein n=1 Tax=Anguilla anguilla TaxID=7936 RepID=A0A0E9VJ63_ANGAN